MKTNILSLSTFLLATFIPTFSIGQDGKQVKRINVRDIYIHTGMATEKMQIGTLSDFKTLAPNSYLLKDDFTDYRQSTGTTITGNAIFSILLGIQLNDNPALSRRKGNPLLRVGFSYYSGSSVSNGYYKTETKPFDTLISQQTGQMYFIDSVTQKSYGMNYSYQQLRFDGSLIFRTNPQARWSFYTGIGITAGVSINANTQIYYNEAHWKETEHSYENNFYHGTQFNSRIRKTENHNNKSNIAFSSYIPLGVDFKLGRRRAFWKSTHLFYELRPSISFTSVPELKTFTNANIQHGPGVRVNWN